MKLFTLMFDLAKLPVVIVKDAVFAIPDSSLLMEPFADTRLLCEKLDEDIRSSKARGGK